MKNLNNIFLNRYPTIDLHGFDSQSAIVAVKDFINENIILDNKIIVIIHGKGQGILKQAIYAFLKTSKQVINYKLDNFNDGVTIVELR